MVKQMIKERRYKGILLLAADSPGALRAVDVDRVMSEAQEIDDTEGFRAWLLAGKLQPRTRQLVIEWTDLS